MASGPASYHMLELTIFATEPTGYGRGSALDPPLLGLPGYAQCLLGRGNTADTH